MNDEDATLSRAHCPKCHGIRPHIMCRRNDGGETTLICMRCDHVHLVTKQTTMPPMLSVD